MKTTSLIQCACGCGETLKDRDSRGRPRQFIYSHWSRVQPNQKTEFSCDQCGKPTKKPQWQIRRIKHYFCSQKCAGQWSSEKGIKRGENNGHFNSITVPCAGCGLPVTKAVSLIMRRNNRVYCPICIPTLKHGRRGFYVGYPKEFSNSLRNKVRNRDDQTCQQCGAIRQDIGTLQVHHIDYDKHNNSPINLISLCRPCHGRTNWATNHWKAHFQAMQASRFPDESTV